MNTTDNRTRAIPAAPEYPPENPRDIINALGRIYLDAGLPLAAAFEAALADYRCSFATPTLCAA